MFDAAIAGNSDVYVVGSDGGHLRRLTSEPSMDGVVVVVGGWALDLLLVDTRRSDSGRLAGLSRRRRSHPNDTQRRLRAERISDGRYLFYLDRHPASLAIGGTARLMRLPLAGGQEELVLERVRPFLWSVTDTGIVFVTREPDFDAIDVYRFSDQRVARLGRLGFRMPGIFKQMTVSRDGRWALATEMVRFDSDLMLLDGFR